MTIDYRTLCTRFVWTLVALSSWRCGSPREGGAADPYTENEDTPAAEALTNGESTCVFQNGVSPGSNYAGAMDTSITRWHENTHVNTGASSELLTGDDGAGDSFRVLLRFDLLNCIPPGAQITKATLELHAFDTAYDAASVNVAAHALNASWAEGNGVDFWTSPSATDGSNGSSWLMRQTNTPWSTAGGDFGAALSSASVPANPAGWIRWNVTPAAKNWFSSPSSNRGILLEPTDGAYQYDHFRSSEYATPSLRPRLTVVYQAAQVSGIHVATTGGVDSNSCGSSSAPCRTIKQGIARATSGQKILVHQGTYYESWLQMKSNTTLLSADGVLAAKIASGNFSAVRFENISGAVFDGFEVYGSYNGGSPSDGLVRVVNSSSITVRNGRFHDAPLDADVIKVNGTVSQLLLENLVVYNPGQRSASAASSCPGVTTWYQENIDVFGQGGSVNDVTVRGCWLFHTEERGGDWLLYSKIGARNILYENNIFGPSAGGGCGNPPVGIGTSEAAYPDASAYVVDTAIVRNNLFVGLQGETAFADMNSNNVWVYNNTFYKNSGSNQRSVIELRGNSRALGSVRIFNNIFQDNQPSAAGAAFYLLRDSVSPSVIYHAYNLYTGNISASNLTYTGETGSLYDVDPLLRAPTIPSTANLANWKSIKSGYRLQSGSPAIDRALDAVAQSGHPNWAPGRTDKRWDFEQQSRPSGAAWDMGADEAQ